MKNDEYEDLLPVGSIVNIRLDERLYMILGYFGVSDKDHNVYDYIAVEYPYGYVGNKMTMFNKKYIKRIIHKGYETDDIEKLFEKVSSDQEGE